MQMRALGRRTAEAEAERLGLMAATKEAMSARVYRNMPDVVYRVP